MTQRKISRRMFTAASTGFLGTLGCAGVGLAQEKAKSESKEDVKQEPAKPKSKTPREAEFERDYKPPKFKPGWKNPQINRLMAQDFVIYAHSDLKMVERLFKKEPGLLNASLDWGNGDWETALGGASHMGRRDIVEFLLSKGARPDLLCCAMMGMLDAVKAMLTIQPDLIDAKGPHGFSLHFHALAGQGDAKPVLDYLQSIKKVELKRPPFLKKKKESKTDAGK